MKTTVGPKPTSRATAQSVTKGASLADNRTRSATQQQLAAAIYASPRCSIQRQAAQLKPGRSALLQVQPAAVVQREDSAGLTAAKAIANGKTADGTRVDPAQLCESLLEIGQHRAEELNRVAASSGSHSAAQASSSSQIRYRISDTVHIPAGKITSVGTFAQTEGTRLVYSIISTVYTDNQCIAEFNNSFYINKATGAIEKMLAGNNYKSKDEQDLVTEEGKLDLYMSDVIKLQYAIAADATEVVSSCCGLRSKRQMNDANHANADLLNGAPAITLPFSIQRTPALKTPLMKALMHARKQGVKQRNLQYIALGSEHGSIVYNLCKEQRIPYNRITFSNLEEAGTLTFTINP